MVKNSKNQNDFVLKLKFEQEFAFEKWKNENWSWIHKFCEDSISAPVHKALALGIPSHMIEEIFQVNIEDF